MKTISFLKASAVFLCTLCVIPGSASPASASTLPEIPNCLQIDPQLIQQEVAVNQALTSLKASVPYTGKGAGLLYSEKNVAAVQNLLAQEQEIFAALLNPRYFYGNNTAEEVLGSEDLIVISGYQSIINTLKNNPTASQSLVNGQLLAIANAYANMANQVASISQPLAGVFVSNSEALGEMAAYPLPNPLPALAY